MDNYVEIYNALVRQSKEDLLRMSNQLELRIRANLGKARKTRYAVTLALEEGTYLNAFSHLMNADDPVRAVRYAKLSAPRKDRGVKYGLTSELNLIQPHKSGFVVAADRQVRVMHVGIGTLTCSQAYKHASCTSTHCLLGQAPASSA